MRPLLALLLLAAAGLVAFWLIGRGGDPAAPTRLAPPGPAPAVAEAPPEPAAVRPPAVEPPPAPAGAESAEPAADQRSVAPVAGPSGERVRVRVVERETGRALGGAEVWALDGQAIGPEQAMRERERGGGVERLVERFGARTVANALGEAVVAAPARVGIVTARHGELWGMAQFERGAAEVVVELAPTRTIRVRVVDGGGRPVAGAPVGLRLRTEHFVRDVWAAATDADGRVDVAHADRWLERADRRERVALAIAVPLDPPVEVEVDPADPPTELVVLRMPPTGSVLVRVEPPDPTERLSVALGLAPDTEGDRYLGMGTPVLVEDGTARFPFVGLGLDLVASVARLASGSPIMHELAGPTVPGQEVVTVVDFATAPYLTGVLVDAAGAPLAGERVRLTLEAETAESASSTSEEVETDSGGRFRYDLGTERAPEAALTLRLEAEDPGGAGARQVSVPVPGPIAAGPNDLGTLVLAPPPLLVSGVVLDGAGRPIEGARVTLERPWQDTGMWITVHRLEEPRSDARGRFAIHGSLDAPELRVKASHPDHVTPEEGATFAPGSVGVEIVLRRATALEGSVRFDEGIPPRAVRVTLHRERRAHSSSPQADGTFRFEGLEPGTVRFTAGVECAPELVDVEGVVLREGEVCRDPRLQEIDLRGRLGTLALTVLEPDGSHARDGTVQALPPPDAPPLMRAFAQWPLAGEPLRIVTAGTGLDLRVEVPGYRTVELRDVSGDRVVELRPGPRVRLRLTGAVLPASPFALGVRLRPEGGTAASSGEVAYLGADGAVELDVPAPGRYTVSWTLEMREANLRTARGLGAARTVVEVADLPGLQELDVPLDPATLQEAIDGFGR